MSNKGGYVVTGAGSGIGRAIALKLVEQGYSVFGLGRSREKLESTARLLSRELFSFYPADLSEASSATSAIVAIRDWLKAKGPLQGLCNNAGVFERTAFVDASDSVWEKYFQVNLLSAVRLTRELYPELKAARGNVLNISSSLGARPVANTSFYSAMKAAMINWTQALALEWAPDGIRVNCVCPGVVDTPIHSFDASARESVGRFHPLGRIGRAEEVAAAACFLMSPASAWTTGAVLNVDGGISL